MQKFILILFVGVLCVWAVNKTMETPVAINDVMLENVEALANTEKPKPMSCQGDGNVTCPINNHTCAYVFIGYSLR